ncbi:uncharacterized protein SPPG_01849 [Spizellomyces punctatus DAOM BR117]|uniref:Uncharacterized protein n=1 Tax=Spizellomyces punctatus (strain DAOM BR117) TaxID=645134 RepID=A0A0L0HNU5_SPIPD|nr:uncharacterized protein SPPG_01849 [Spizellomyces punctatus DAOM BR117]KND02767.1 hypothetical protein SPPG_01849 [Spizellomyces punctatus DAOM BR117]|eukprot:XP_016610806.1 hypothetical protein SPPG_01849 [Spizellomyces punctatus DAOM BR117]
MSNTHKLDLLIAECQEGTARLSLDRTDASNTARAPTMHHSALNRGSERDRRNFLPSLDSGIRGQPAPLPKLAGLIWMLVRLAAGASGKSATRNLRDEKEASRKSRADAIGIKAIKHLLISTRATLPQLVIALIYLSRLRRSRSRSAWRRPLPFLFVTCLQLASDAAHRHASSSTSTNLPLDLSVSDKEFGGACKRVKEVAMFWRKRVILKEGGTLP